MMRRGMMEVGRWMMMRRWMMVVGRGIMTVVGRRGRSPPMSKIIGGNPLNGSIGM